MISEYLTLFRKTGIALFCLWHMAAIGFYCIPGDANDPVSTYARNHITGRFVPYLLLSSQWQQWNLFAPNPLRRIVFYRIEKQNADGEWSYVTTINRTTYGWARHAVRFKLLGQAIEENTKRPELAERAAQVLCDEYRFDAYERMRIWHVITVVPYVHPSPSKAWWDTWEPQFDDVLAFETTCQP